MRLKLIRIGNSRGVRLPMSLIRQYHLDGSVDVELAADGFILRPAEAVREGWAERFREATEGQDTEESLWQEVPGRFDEEEWTW